MSEEQPQKVQVDDVQIALLEPPQVNRVQKRNNLNLFLAKKRGTLVKEAPDAYGTKGQKHFYFISSIDSTYFQLHGTILAHYRAGQSLDI